MSNLEAVAALFGLLNILLLARRSIWNFPAALIMVSLTGVVLWDARLDSDAALQIFFFVVNLFGWLVWHRRKERSGEILVERLGLAGRMVWIIGALSASWGWGWIMARHTDASHPLWDASVAMLSIAAQILMTRRYIDHWHWWVVINILSIGLYWTKELYWFTGLYVVFLGMSVWGLAQWRLAEARQGGGPQS